METAAILIIFMASLLVGITGYSVYTSFGSASKNLRDPFEAVSYTHLTLPTKA